MSVKPYKTTRASTVSGNLQTPTQQTSRLQVEAIAREAKKIEDLLRKLLYLKTDIDNAWEVYTANDSKLKNLNSFGKQVVTRMLRSNPGFQGFKVEFKDPVLKPDVLFLIGTLCDDFDHMNTSPLYGLNILDVGCGSLSPYLPPDESSNLVDQFYSDQPPVAAELLQILGAHTIGIDPRLNCKERYEYQISYKHRAVDFSAISHWLQTIDCCFDVVSCLHLFNKPGFAYHYALPEQISQFLKTLKQAMLPKGLLYCTLPLIPLSDENRQTNYQIFDSAGFKILYEGYYLIVQSL